MGINTVHKIYGSKPFKTARELINHTDLFSDISEHDRVCIKPNVLLARPSDSGATTDPDIVEAIIKGLQKKGVQDITIAEGAWLGDDTKKSFKVCGYARLARKFGTKLVDLKKDRFVSVVPDVPSPVTKKIQIAKTILETDKIINVPVLKAHCQTKLTCAMKNLMGCISDNDKRMFHNLSLIHI